ncbi:hypothetical protein RclHR1_02910002 [Rhizophagus clarus]|uniref:SUI1 domain-containing protein n=5 Tax=Rhizophagus TaxID=1129544 RepID=A0A2Z6RGD1_9GLOM|nr:hypothetical protein RclHR1_02910002 [Rhizophagus clarus]
MKFKARSPVEESNLCVQIMSTSTPTKNIALSIMVEMLFQHELAKPKIVTLSNWNACYRVARQISIQNYKENVYKIKLYDIGEETKIRTAIEKLNEYCTDFGLIKQQNDTGRFANFYYNYQVVIYIRTSVHNQIFFMSEIQNLQTYDPFADTGEEEAGQPQGYIHIRIQQRNGRKTLTTVQGLPSEYDQKKLLKAFKKEFACNGTLVQDEELGQIIQLQGDQRLKVQNFLGDNGIDKNIIKIHGF